MIRRFLCLTGALLGLSALAVAQSVRPRVQAVLPASLAEISGLVADRTGGFWSINDSGDGPFLYKFDAKGAVLQRVFVKNAQNVDWEALQSDPQGRFLYIGDFGNNGQKRRDLAIYRVPLMAPMPDSVAAERLPFYYPDQMAFPPAEAARHFDAEAFLVTSDSIYVLSKDFYQKPYLGQTSVYRLSLNMMPQQAIWVKNIPTDARSPYRGAITDAAQSPDGQTVLLAYRRVFLFEKPLLGQKWHDVTPKIFRLPFWMVAQLEAIDFDPTQSCRWFLSSEGLKKWPARLFVCHFCKSTKRS